MSSQLFNSRHSSQQQMCYGPLCGGEARPLWEFRKIGVRHPERTLNQNCRRCNDHLNALRKDSGTYFLFSKPVQTGRYQKDDWLVTNSTDESSFDSTESTTTVSVDDSDLQALRNRLQEVVGDQVSRKKIPSPNLSRSSDSELTEDDLYQTMAELPIRAESKEKRKSATSCSATISAFQSDSATRSDSASQSSSSTSSSVLVIRKTKMTMTRKQPRFSRQMTPAEKRERMLTRPQSTRKNPARLARPSRAWLAYHGRISRY